VGALLAQLLFLTMQTICIKNGEKIYINDETKRESIFVVPILISEWKKMWLQPIYIGYLLVK